MSRMAVIFWQMRFGKLSSHYHLLKNMNSYTYIFMAVEVFEKFDFTKSSFGQDLLLKDLGYLFYCHLFICLGVCCGTRLIVPKRN